MNRTGVVWEPIFAGHVMGRFHPESPGRIMGIKDVLDGTAAGKACKRIPARPATKDEIAWVHAREYIDYIESTKGRTEMLDPDTTACPLTWEAACMAAGGTIECVKAVLSGDVDNAYAFVRPPGHHAERDSAMGFCVFNNIAMAAEYAVKKHGLKKIAIVDFDVHHGNGTEHAFYKRPDVFYISTHRSPFYPGTGAREEHGEGAGKGFNLNVPFPAGTGDAEFKKVYADIVIPVIEEYCPELLLVSAGYDAHKDDPLGGLEVSTGTYNWLTSEFVKAAKKCCNGALVFVLEGGYNVDALKECAEGALKEMEG